MKKLFILFILLTLFLSGCSIYDINSFTLPDDIEFIAVVESLDTPEKIGDYMYDNFESEEHPYITLTPYELYNIKKGDCTDFATFAVFVANYHHYDTYQIKMLFLKPINPTNYWHSIAIYKENNSFTVSENQYYWKGEYFKDFKSIMDIFIDWTKYIIYDYDMNIVEKGTNN